MKFLGRSSNSVLITAKKLSVTKSVKTQHAELFSCVIICSVIPLYAGRKLNVHKTFKRRPGFILNVLCTFSLLLVFREYNEVKLFRKTLREKCTNTVFSPNIGKYGPELTPYFGHFPRSESSHDSGQYFCCIFRLKTLGQCIGSFVFSVSNQSEVFRRKGFVKRFWIIYRKTPPPCNFIKKATSSKLFSC